MAETDRVIAIALGDIAHGQAEAAVAGAIGRADVEWLDRGELRRKPVPSIRRLMAFQYAAAVLVAPDLCQPRLCLTSLVLGLVRARRRWRVDLCGRVEEFDLAAHVSATGLEIARHLLSCAVALILAEPVFRFLQTMIRPRLIRTRRPRRLLYLRSQLWLGLTGGGSVAHTAGVIGGLTQCGVDVAVVTSDALHGVAVPTRVVAPEIWFDGTGREAEELAYNAPFFLAALQVARRTCPDVLYQRHTAFNVTGALLSRLLKIPFVLEFNSSEVWKGRHWGGLELDRIAQRVETINLRAADRVVVVSQVLRDWLLELGIPDEKIVVNPNGVDPCQFRPDVDGADIRHRYGFDSEAIVVGFSGTFGVWHGIPTLAAATPRVLNHHADVCFLLIGDGPLAHLVDGLGERVKRTGAVSHSDMPTYLAACDVLVSPHGRQADGGEFFGSPTKLYEYMAAGRPIVASAVGQIREVLADGRTALLVPPDDVDALCDAIGRLAEEPCLRSHLGAAARTQAVAHHTWRHNSQRLLASLDLDG